jgi:polyketide biosynthesis enoyl-CoA hydratase PksI
MTDSITMSEDASGITYLKLNDTKHKNCFTDAFIADFIKALDAVEENKSPQVLVLHGLPDVFCAGADKENLIALSRGEVRVKDLLISERILNIKCPVIAAMEGHAVGGGLMVAVCCDMVVAARESRYGATFMELGFTPGMGCTMLLELLVGPFLAAEMMYTARLFKGSELAARGAQFNAIVPRDEVMKTALDMALRIQDKNPDSLALLKYTLTARKKKLLVEARVQEDLMHRITFGLPETKRRIEELYNS